MDKLKLGDNGMFKRIKGIAMAATVLAGASLVAGCASNPVSTDYDNSADFAKYRSFNFVAQQSAEGEQYQSLLDKRLEASITNEMQSRGYSLAAAGTAAELSVDYHAHVEEKQKVVSSPEPVHWGRGWYDPWPAYNNNVRTVDYKQGTLIINLVDTANKQMVWQGTMQGTVKRSSIENPGPAVADAVARMFSEYPFKAGSGN